MSGGGLTICDKILTFLLKIRTKMIGFDMRKVTILSVYLG